MSDPRSNAVEFSISALDSPQTFTTVRKRLTEAEANHIKNICSGTAKDWGESQRRQGRLEGVREAIAVLNDVERENSK